MHQEIPLTLTLSRGGRGKSTVYRHPRQGEGEILFGDTLKRQRGTINTKPRTST